MLAFSEEVDENPLLALRHPPPHSLFQPEEVGQEAVEEPLIEPLLEPEGENYEEPPQVRRDQLRQHSGEMGLREFWEIKVPQPFNISLQGSDVPVPPAIEPGPV